MTKEETMQVLVVIQAAYQNFNPKDKSVTIDLWHAMLGGYEYRAVMAAVQTYIASDTKGFAPVIGQIIDTLQKITRPEQMGEMEAWGLVSKALRNGIYGYVDEYNKLPPLVQKALGSADQLHWWAMDEHYNEDVAMSNFIRSYKTVCARADEHDRIPESARMLIEDATYRLEGNNDR